MESSGEVKMYYDVREAVRGRHVLLVEDIVDTGVTLNFLREHFMEKEPESLRICGLLNKKGRRMVDVPRITSYNVCYTKLLRPQGPLGGMTGCCAPALCGAVYITKKRKPMHHQCTMQCVAKREKSPRILSCFRPLPQQTTTKHLLVSPKLNSH